MISFKSYLNEVRLGPSQWKHGSEFDLHGGGPGHKPFRDEHPMHASLKKDGWIPSHDTKDDTNKTHKWKHPDAPGHELTTSGSHGDSWSHKHNDKVVETGRGHESHRIMIGPKETWKDW